jgi:PAS domain S-box-containing protein
MSTDQESPFERQARIEAELTRRTAVLEAVTYVATQFVRVADWRPTMPELLARLGTATNASRAFLFEMHAAPGGAGKAQSCRFIWSAPEVPSVDEARLQNMPIPDSKDSALGELLARRSRGEVIQITRSEARGDMRRWLEYTETCSLLSVPIMVEASYWGSLGFDDCMVERVWSGVEVDLLKTVTALIASVIERSRADERLRERDNLLVSAQRIAQMGSWVLDFATGKVSWSEEGRKIFGLDATSDNWTHEANLQRIHTDDRALVAAADARARDRGEAFEIEYRILRPTGEERTLRERADVVRDDAGRPHRLVGIVHDITEMRRNETELVRQREALYHNEKMAMLGSLLAGVAHELNNPLSVVIGQVAMLEQSVSEPALLNRIERIQKATERCARIVRTFLAMARHRERQSAPVKINSLVVTVVELLAFQLRAADIRVELELASEIPDFMADADQLHQLLTNLIVNARQALAASTQRRRTIHITTSVDRVRNRLQLAVLDNGPGVPADIRKRIFDPFFTTKPAGEGTGIGLSLCSSIVRAHGGVISVSDSAGGGARFTVDLPLRSGAAGAPDPGAEDPPNASRVLIIEDEAEIADMLSEILRAQGHRTHVAANGRDGLDCALAEDFDIVLSDIRLPHMDGLDMYRALQRQRPRLVPRVAFITGDTLSPDIQSFLAETGAACLEKPFLPGDVLRLMARLAAETRAQG